MFTVRMSPFWRKDLLDPANRHRSASTKAAAEQRRVRREENLMLVSLVWRRVGKSGIV
jgi:hypothetical protein